MKLKQWMMTASRRGLWRFKKGMAMPFACDEAYDELVQTDCEKQEIEVDFSGKTPVLVVDCLC